MRLPRSLRWRLAFAYTVLALGAIGILSLYLVGFVRATYIEDLEVRLEHEAALVAETAAPFFDGGPDLRGLREAGDRLGNAVEARVTIAAEDGTVLADTWEDPAVMANHAGRPEIADALAIGRGRSTRHSATVDRDMMYAAVPIAVGTKTFGVARVALPTSQIQSNVNRIILTVSVAALLVSSLSVVLAFILAGRTSRSVRSITSGARRLTEGDLGHRVEALTDDETQELAQAFNNMALTLKGVIEDLSDEKDKLSTVLETMTDGVIVVDADGQIELVNPSARALLGPSGAQVPGSQLIEAVRDHEIQEVVEASRQSGGLEQAEVELMQPRRLLRALAIPLGEPGGRVLLTVHDLTRVSQLDTTRREFVSNVSHELRSPLASIKAMVETLEGGALDERRQAEDFLGRIHRDVDRMTVLVNDLLELSRLESGHAPLNLEPVALGPLIAEAVAGLTTGVGAQIESAIPTDLPFVVGEQNKLRQVLTNLLENALRAISVKGIVTVSAREMDLMVEVRVADTGVGIAPEHIPHIFERFYKVDRARSEEGSGLGLAIVKHIVQAHGGEVRMESDEGAGSTFLFTIPRTT